MYIVKNISKTKFLFHLCNSLVRHSSHCRYKYSNEVEAAVNKQIQSEHHVAMEYLNMAAGFLHPSVSYPGAGGYFMKMYKEELHHMEVLINFQLLRGGMPLMSMEHDKEVSKLNLTLVEAFTKAVDMEKNITEQLEKIVSTAEAMKDVQCADFFTSKFLNEQMHSIHDLCQRVTVLNRLCNDEQALWHYDKQLAKSFPYHIKI